MSATVTVTVIVSVVDVSETDRITTQISSLLFAPQPWFSKSGAFANAKAPLEASMLNKS